MFGIPIGGDLGGVEPDRDNLSTLYDVPYEELVIWPGISASPAEADAAHTAFLQQWAQ